MLSHVKNMLSTENDSSRQIVFNYRKNRYVWDKVYCLYFAFIARNKCMPKQE